MHKQKHETNQIREIYPQALSSKNINKPDKVGVVSLNWNIKLKIYANTKIYTITYSESVWSK